MADRRREFYTKQLAQLEDELAAVEADLETAATASSRRSLEKHVEKLLSKIDQLEAKLSELDAVSSTLGIRTKSLEKALQKINFVEAKEIATSIRGQLQKDGGAALFLLQKAKKQMGYFCLEEVLSILFGDQIVDGQVMGAYRRFSVDLDSATSRFSKTEFLIKISSYFNIEAANNSEDIYQGIKKNIRDQIESGITIFIEFKNIDEIRECQVFLKWFVRDFWIPITNECADSFKVFKAKLIAALVADSLVLSDSLPEYFCGASNFDGSKILELPLPNWSIDDIYDWLIRFRSLLHSPKYKSKDALKRIAQKIFRDSEGVPQSVCAELQDLFLSNLKEEESDELTSAKDLLHQSTVRIETAGGNVTGYFVAPGLILTCAHALTNIEMQDFISFTWKHQSGAAKIIARNNVFDIALLQSQISTRDVSYLLLEEAARTGDRLYVFGYPDEYPEGYSSVFECEGYRQESYLAMRGGKVFPGMSGAPVLNERTGKVCALVNASRDKRSELNSTAILSSVVLKEFSRFLKVQDLTSQEEATWSSSSSLDEETSTITYNIYLVPKWENVFLGDEISVEILLSSAELRDTSVENHVMELSYEQCLGQEISIFLISSGLQIIETNVASLPLDTNNLLYEDSCTATFRLTALRAGISTITAELYLDDALETTFETNVEIYSLEGAFWVSPNLKIDPRPVPQPDLILQIQTGWNETLSRCTLNYHLDSFHPRLAFASEIQQRSETFSAEWLSQTRRFLQNTLEEVSSSLSEDCYSRLTSLGKHLFQQLLPQELQATFCSIMRFNVPFTLLILADQDAEFPWELLHDGQSFWGERFIMGRWPLEMEKTRPYEFAIGAVSLAHYENVEQPEQWSGLLEPSGAPPPMKLSGGMLADLGSVEVMRGLHLLRRGTSPEEIERQDAPVPLESNGSEDLEQSLRPAKLSLRRNRPLVTLGYLNAGVPELTTLEHTWAPTFIRSGCSTFIGPLWAVQPAVETAFTSSFYHRLWAGESLGMAFQAGRRAAKAIVPDSLDWMAYVLYGDPMARPYRPTVGKGYAVVEPIGQEITDRVAPGSSVRFRVSLRRTPPIWYSDRLMDVAEDLTFEDLRVYIVASGLQVTPGDSIDMQRSPSGDYLGWFTLTVPSNFEGDSALVRVHYEDGDDPVHSLRFALSVGNGEVERP